MRKTKCYSKKKASLINALELFQFHWNFMDILRDKRTPAMFELLADDVWSWDDFLTFSYAL